MLYYDVYHQIGSGEKKIVLIKGRQKYTFKYNPGEEDKLLDLFIQAAKDKRIDWFDSALLSFKLTQSLIGQIDELLVGATHQSFDPRDFYQKS